MTKPRYTYAPCRLRDFLGLTLPEAPPDHSTISGTRRRSATRWPRRSITLSADGTAVDTAAEVVADKGCHSRAVVLDLTANGFRSSISEPDRGAQSCYCMTAVAQER